MNDALAIKFGLTPTQYHLIESAIISFNDIEKVLIFGSRATHRSRSASDIDLAVIGKNLNRVIINRLSSELDDLPLPFMFDVLHYDQIENSVLKSKIDSEGKLFFEKQKNTTT
jgi:uncharacterized protein